MAYSITECHWALLVYDTMHGSSDLLSTYQLTFFYFVATLVWSIFNHIPQPLLTSYFKICCHTGNFVYFIHFLVDSDFPKHLLSYWPFHLPYMQDMRYSQSWWRFLFQVMTSCKLLYGVQTFWRSLLPSLEMDTAGSPETLVSIFESTQHHFSKDWSLRRTQNVTVPHI